MYAGRVMEEVRAADLSRATHPYTRGLLGCLPSLVHPRPRLAVMARDPAWLEDGGPGTPPANAPWQPAREAALGSLAVGVEADRTAESPNP
jgi:ABC-type dipeptide/oligopeptide/nickel transport system ATPase component